MKKIFLLIVLCLFVSCGEKLIEKPENLIPRDKMENILYDLSVLTAARNTSLDVLKENAIEPMDYLFTKYAIDSVQFAESDIYYAAIPVEYQNMYIRIEEKLLAKKEIMDKAKKVADSIKKAEREARKAIKK